MSKYSPLISRTLKKLSQEQLDQFSDEDWEALLELASTDLEDQEKQLSQSLSRTSNRFDRNRNEAIVVRAIEPGRSGRVRFAGSWWSAQSEQQSTFLPGEIVEVVGRRNLTLLIQPVKASSQNKEAASQQISEKIDFPIQLTKTSNQATEAKFQQADKVSANGLSPVHSFIQKGDRIIAFASGGAFAGGLIAQIPGAIIGAVAGAMFGWFESSKIAKTSEEP
jgi:hypothetical protein